ncbi:hypothetical protein B0I08_10790 [Glaciihabitans tibetensis]|uniref:Maltokinase N-terminal cap domain-containing protein n=1 Tax=Glaciihabitans tibetensis TaxID=1266600 RepID=A0A2T0VAH1_9MICO|nr:hypothetical protein [Glaciihabitans tibetensis]PRY67195.1 hypothetical protein B0I08_10790 [Glaciihabitans tibetensis]
MAILHPAQVTPSKIELVQSWAPQQPFFKGDVAAELSVIASFRYDDPQGEVGIETLIVRVPEGELLHVPVTYRGAPLEGGEPWLIGTMEHSVLGSRWVYDAAGDPVYIAEIASAAFSGATEVDQFVNVDGVLVPKASTAHAVGTGAVVRTFAVPSPGSVSTSFDGRATVVEAGDLRLAIVRRISEQTTEALRGYRPEGAEAHSIIATWDGQDRPFRLAEVWER